MSRKLTIAPGRSFRSSMEKANEKVVNRLTREFQRYLRANPEIAEMEMAEAKRRLDAIAARSMVRTKEALQGGVAGAMSAAIKREDRRVDGIWAGAAEQRIDVDVVAAMRGEVVQAALAAQRRVVEEMVWELGGNLQQQMVNESLRALREGVPLDELIRNLPEATTPRKAALLARNQVQSYNSVANRSRASALGVQTAEWVTNKDAAVRPSHQDRDGKTYDVQVGLYSELDGLYIFPGIDFNCRCRERFILPPRKPTK